MAVVQVAHARRRKGNAQSFAAVNLADTFIIHEVGTYVTSTCILFVNKKPHVKDQMRE